MIEHDGVRSTPKGGTTLSAGDASGKPTKPPARSMPEKSVDRSTAGAPETSKAGSAKRAASAPITPVGDRDMGSALRQVYQRTVEEAIPDEMMDLLSKLD